MTHAPINWWLSCHQPGNHHWDKDCAHNRDDSTHPYRCCRHDAIENVCTCDHERPDGRHVPSPGCRMCEWCRQDEERTA